MSKNVNIRAVQPNDIAALKRVIDANELFPAEMLDEMLSDYFENVSVDNEHIKDLWFTYATDQPVAIAYCAPEKMTMGTWNLYLIAVHPEHQGKGYGTSLLHYIEQILAEQGERVLPVSYTHLTLPTICSV